MHQDKGFTLVELLAVIVVLSIILLIAVPNVLKIINNAKDDAYERQKELIVDASKKYIMLYPEDVEWTDDIASITVAELQTKKLLPDNLKDPRTGDEFEADKVEVTITKGDNQYTYFMCGDTLIDKRDGQTWEYATVKIGNQCWMAENLRYTKECLVNDEADWTDSATACMEHNPIPTWATADTNEVLYQWKAAMAWDGVTPLEELAGTRGLCPEGWYIPTDGDWTTLVNEVKGEDNKPGTHLKSTKHWKNDSNGDNSSGFTGIPASCRDAAGALYFVGYYGFFWSSSSDGSDAWGRCLAFNYSSVDHLTNAQAFGYSVRCLRGQ